jgi:hypothetical protein
MAEYFSRTCSRSKQKMMVQMAKQVRNGMIRTISGYCNQCGHRFDWLLIRGKTFYDFDKLTARL